MYNNICCEFCWHGKSYYKRESIGLGRFEHTPLLPKQRFVERPAKAKPRILPEKTVLTHDLEVNVLADVRRGGYLAFVDSRVPDLRVFDLQRPVLAGRLIDRPEPLVAGVRVPAYGQQVNVPVPDPRDLRIAHNVKTNLSGSIEIEI